MTTHTIQHDPASGVFSTTVDGELAVLEYRREGDWMTILHTGVPDAIASTTGSPNPSWRDG